MSPSERPALNISPIHAEYYGIQFCEWRGDVAALFSGKEENAVRAAEIELVLGHPVELIPVAPAKIKDMGRQRFGIGASAIVTIANGPVSAANGAAAPGAGEPVPGETPSPGALRASAEPAIIHFVNHIIDEAFMDRATDIHIEPYSDHVEIRYRIDGVLHRIPAPGEITGLHRAVVSRLKILSHLDIAEQRLPQDGRFRFALQGGQDLDVRISILPTAFGEAVDLRLLTTRQVYKGLGSLGLSDVDQELALGILARPHGVVLVTGPTGSGKTTSLYAFLTLLNESDRKIITIEDPIEYQIPGITQVQVNPKIELDFARGLRSMLRHDPDVMMVGEIRDYETADTTIQVALTGHLVFSTVHTNDAPSTPARLINMGVEPYLVASSLECVIAQRLVRLICDNCREVVAPGDDPLGPEAVEQLERYGVAWDGRLERGAGCDACMGTGYHGRTAVYEILPVGEGIQAVILKQAAASTLRAAAEEQGFRSMRRDGLAKVASKRTTFAEILRVTRKEIY